MDDLRVYVPFNGISVISGRWADDNERLCAITIERIPPRAGLEPGITLSVGQPLTY